MTLLQKIQRELGPNVEIKPARLTDREAIEIRQGAFVATIYADAATGQIRHLDAYHAARDAANDLRRTVTVRDSKYPIPYLAINSTAWKSARAKIDRFRKLAGRSVEGDPTCG
jgi:hypothetical protein